MKQNNYGSWPNSRAIFAGIVSTYGIMILLMVLGAAVGAWGFKFSEIPELGLEFWIWSFIAWIVSITVGSAVAASAARAQTLRDGFLHALVTWAASTVFGCLILGLGTGRAFYFTDAMTKASFFGVFIGNLLALAGAYYGCVWGIQSELRAEENDEEERKPWQTKIKRSEKHESFHL